MHNARRLQPRVRVSRARRLRVEELLHASLRLRLTLPAHHANKNRAWARILGPALDGHNGLLDYSSAPPADIFANRSYVSMITLFKATNVLGFALGPRPNPPAPALAAAQLRAREAAEADAAADVRRAAFLANIDDDVEDHIDQWHDWAVEEQMVVEADMAHGVAEYSPLFDDAAVGAYSPLFPVARLL